MRSVLTRRELLAAAVAGSLACGAGRKGRPVGLNLYTVRGPLAEDPERVLRELAAIGCRYVEGRLAQVEKHLPLLAELGMPWISWMIDTPVVTGGWDAWQQFMAGYAKAMNLKSAPVLERTTLEQTIEIALQHGVQNLGISYTLPPEREGPDGWERIAEQCNRAGEACRSAGLRFYFHNHAEEFAGAPGERPFDLLLERLDPKHVRFEIDVFWVSIAGADPADAIRQARGRVLSLHLKDKAANAPNVTAATGAPPDAFREVGAGSLDWPAILSAAKDSGVEYLFVEQDQTPGDPLDSVRQSFEYLDTLSR